ncbi:hypothetical protein BpHYR1_026669 [Brachionus plicatilis]|uniref:C-type lectin domain-containing protein n=1 Tax=Brachionus plicatilis TaxID=10195 RepID=A0A3M7Q2C5_BRAPC|nr:hypothetical protein BpHYR1_026669 [Brachionus plicatilis]
MIKFLAILNLINLILCQQQQKPLSSRSFGRDFNNSIRTRNFDNRISACTNPASYDFIQRAGTSKYYAIADIQMNWIDAENYCQKFGAHLPVASSARFVGGKFMNPSYENYNSLKIMSWSGYWLGLYKSLEKNTWRWIDDSPLTYFDWDKTFQNHDGSLNPQPQGGLEYFVVDLYEIKQKKHRGWHDHMMLGYSLVLCELKYIFR